MTSVAIQVLEAGWSPGRWLCCLKRQELWWCQKHGRIAWVTKHPWSTIQKPETGRLIEKSSIGRSYESEKYWIFSVQGLFQPEKIDILSCNLTGIKPRYDSALNEISGFFFSIWIPHINAVFVLLLQAYSVCYMLFCLFLFFLFTFYSLFKWFIFVFFLPFAWHFDSFLWKLVTYGSIQKSRSDSMGSEPWVTNLAHTEWNYYSAECCRGRPRGAVW